MVTWLQGGGGGIAEISMGEVGSLGRENVTSLQFP